MGHLNGLVNGGCLSGGIPVHHRSRTPYDGDLFDNLYPNSSFLPEYLIPDRPDNGLV